MLIFVFEKGFYKTIKETNKIIVVLNHLGKLVWLPCSCESPSCSIWLPKRSLQVITTTSTHPSMVSI